MFEVAMEALFILLASCTSLAEGICIKRYNTRHQNGGFFFTALISLFSMLFFFVTDGNGFHAPSALWIYGICSGIFYCSASFLTYLALQCGPFAQSNLILSYSVVFKIGYGIFFLREVVTKPLLLGIAVILVSLYLIRPVSDTDAKCRITGKWVVCIGISSIGCGMVGVLQKMQQVHFDNTCNHEFMIITLSFSFSCLPPLDFGRNADGLAGFCVSVCRLRHVQVLPTA